MVKIREVPIPTKATTTEDDNGISSSLEKLYSLTFPDEDLLPLLRNLAKYDQKISSQHGRILSLIAVDDDNDDDDEPLTVLGSIFFTYCQVVEDENDTTEATIPQAATIAASTVVALLGPVAVAPERQKHGIGSMLIRQGIQRISSYGSVHKILVLGDPNFYKRYNFQQERNIQPPYTLREEWKAAWQSITFNNNPDIVGKLVVPDPWKDKSLWTS